MRVRLIQGTETSPATTSAVEIAASLMRERYLDELCAKLGPQEVPDFELDVATAKPPEHFAERFAQAVPRVDRAPTEP